MKNYFTSIEHINDKFIGSVHDASNNQLVFRTTKPHNTPAEAIQEVNSFLQNNQPSSINEGVATVQASTPLQPVSPAPEQPKRCCGR
jgi:hypothetical protein